MENENNGQALRQENQKKPERRKREEENGEMMKERGEILTDIRKWLDEQERGGIKQEWEDVPLSTE